MTETTQLHVNDKPTLYYEEEIHEDHVIRDAENIIINEKITVEEGYNGYALMRDGKVIMHKEDVKNVVKTYLSYLESKTGLLMHIADTIYDDLEKLHNNKPNTFIRAYVDAFLEEDFQNGGTEVEESHIKEYKQAYDNNELGKLDSNMARALAKAISQ